MRHDITYRFALIDFIWKNCSSKAFILISFFFAQGTEYEENYEICQVIEDIVCGKLLHQYLSTATYNIVDR